MPTTTAMHGADADELERIAGTLRSAADELDGHAGSVTTTLRAVAWVGGVASVFGANWSGGHRPRITSTARYVRDAAAQLDHHAAEQRRASQVSDSASGGSIARGVHAGGALGSSSSTADGEIAPIDRLGAVFAALDLGHDGLEALAQHARALEGVGLDELLDVVTDDDFVSLLAGLDQAIEVGDVLVDLVGDFVEHPDLPFDERIVHALADAATRFGINQGVEHAARFLAQASTTALLPGLGAALAPFAGQAAGAIADAAIGEIVDAVDDATGVVDIAADAAVEAYRNLVEAFGLVGDAAGAVLDAAAATVGVAADVAADAVRSLDPFDLVSFDLDPFG